MRDLINQIKKAVVFLGVRNHKGQPEFKATGFLIHVEDICHLVTAKHVVCDPQTGEMTDAGMFAFFNQKDGTVAARSLDSLKQTFHVEWIFHGDEAVDAAMVPFGLNPQTDDVKTIPSDMFLTPDRLFELYDVFFLSYQPGVRETGRVVPVIRSGSISLINEDGSFYIDGAAFPGNSGSPVLLKPSPIRFDEGNITIGSDPLGGSFIGMVGEYIPYREVAISAQTRRPRVIFEENTGLSKVWSVKFITEIASSEQFKRQLRNLPKGRNQAG